ncbi:MAG: protein-L-isoaspartate(D-aspartate) O-methyltransferase [Pirellulales bacterium]
MRALSIACLLLTLLSASANTSLAQRLDPFALARNRMVDEEIVQAGVTNPRVIETMRQTPRHEFVLPNSRHLAYYDMALPIGEQQTISPPFIVAYMTEQIDPQPTDRVLEIGTGSGYQAAVLSPLVKEVYTIEIVESLGERAAKTLRRLDYENVHPRIGDGFLGWPEHAPFDKIIVTCSPEDVPQPLVDQLAEGGLMIVPVGERYQQVLYRFAKKDGKLERQALRPTLFVPMTGQAEVARDVQPNPTNPTLVNGGFESLLEGGESPSGWHYQRQLTLVEDPEQAREGQNYITLRNAEPGRGSRALQGFAIDGRAVALLEVSASVRGNSLQPGQDRRQMPSLMVTFYDDSRAMIGHGGLGPWVGTFDWRRDATRVVVPPNAREAIFRLDMLGAVGEIAFDDLQMRVVPRRR